MVTAELIMAGTQPAGLYRSEDAGKKWQKLGVSMKPYALTGYYLGDKPYSEGHPGAYGRKHWTRVTQIVFDPNDSSLVWAASKSTGRGAAPTETQNPKRRQIDFSLRSK